jgi:hypothetical protein
MEMERYQTSEEQDTRAYAAALTRCAGTWLATPPDAAEQERIAAASKALREQRRRAVEFHQDPTAATLFSINLFRDAAFAPLHLERRLIAQMIAAQGEPPEVADPDDPEFVQYLRRAILSIAHARLRKALAAQLRRYLPRYVAAEDWQAAIALDHNAFRTALGNEVSPFLLQMTLEGLARYYEELEAEPEDTPLEEA